MSSVSVSSNAARDGSRSTVIIVGNGMVGFRLCERLREQAGADAMRIIVFGDEPRPAYDRVQLTKYFATRDPETLSLADRGWYADHEIELHTEARVTSIDRDARAVATADGRSFAYDALVLATGSAALVPRVPGVELPGVFVYRTIEDLESIIHCSRTSTTAAVIGGGLLGLEAARAVVELGLTTHVVELARGLMPRQLDGIGSRLLERSIRTLGVTLHLGKSMSGIEGEGRVERLCFADGDALDVDMVVLSAGIRPRDELARAAGIEVGPRGGIVVDDALRTSDPHVYAVGEAALHRGQIYGLVAPGYDMADALARTLTSGTPALFGGADLSAKLKLMGVEVASFGNPFADGPETSTVAVQDFVRGVYKKLIVTEDGKQLIGGMLVGETREYSTLVHYARTGEALPTTPDELIMGARGGAQGGGLTMPDTAQVCSCHNLSKGAICERIRADNLVTVDDVKRCTKAGTGCGGCVPAVTDLLSAELKARGAVVKSTLCEHFDYTRTELFQIVSVKDIHTFEDLLAQYGRGYGCEICKPAVGSILASVHNEMILDRHATLQDTNDRFLANIQRRGLYSVVPRIPGGEITPQKLIRLGEIAEKYGLYTKITGGQRIDMFGARLNQLPDIWEDLVNAGFESGHAYGKAMRTVKSCVGSTWCRYGVQDSVGLAIRIENRYRGLRAPHKLKSAVSGCVRECAEAQSKDFGIIATEKGYNLYVCGNGGAKPRHADLIASDLDEETLVRYVDRFLMFYIRTADRLTRTSVWIEKLEGGLDHLKDVIIHDKLGLCAELEQQMQRLVDTYECEWAAVVKSRELRERFRHFANSEEGDDSFAMLSEREQSRPLDWDKRVKPLPERRLPLLNTRWVPVGKLSDLPANGGVNFKHGKLQIAVFRFAARGELYATQNMCPHKQDMVLARGLLGDKQGEPKVACPQHKKTFSLRTGECLSGDELHIRTFPVKEEDGVVYVELPPSQQLEAELCPNNSASCASYAEQDAGQG